MLISALVFFAIAILMAYYRFKGTNPTLKVIARILFYFSLLAFCVLLIVYILNSGPPLPEGKKNLPL